MTGAQLIAFGIGVPFGWLCHVLWLLWPRRADPEQEPEFEVIEVARYSRGRDVSPGFIFRVRWDGEEQLLRTERGGVWFLDDTGAALRSPALDRHLCAAFRRRQWDQAPDA